MSNTEILLLNQRIKELEKANKYLDNQLATLKAVKVSKELGHGIESALNDNSRIAELEANNESLLNWLDKSKKDSSDGKSAFDSGMNAAFMDTIDFINKLNKQHG